jgi:hypothetical protein
MATRKPAWRKDRITSTVDEATGIRVVEWPRVKGMTAEQVEALGTFEREHLGTTRAVIRMNKRAQGDEVPVPHRLTLVTIPADLAEFYA